MAAKAGFVVLETAGSSTHTGGGSEWLEYTPLYQAATKNRIVVGTKDFIIKGHKTEIFSWLTDRGNVRVSSADGYGDSVYLILRGRMATAAEEFQKAYAGAAFGGTPLSPVAAVGSNGIILSAISGASSGGTDLASAVLAVAEPIISEGIDKSIERPAKEPNKFQRVMDMVFGKSFTLRLSASRGTFSDKGAAKGSVLPVANGTRCDVLAGVFRELNWS